MNTFLIILAIILIILGIVGAVLPVLPGPIISWLGLLTLHFTDGITLSITFLVVTFLVALAIFILDYIIPALGTKKFGGSKWGMFGATIGLVVGLFAPIPFGIIIGPFVGAVLGEIIHGNDINKALKAAFGSLLGFLASTFLKLVVAIIYLGFFSYELMQYKGHLI